MWLIISLTNISLNPAFLLNLEDIFDFSRLSIDFFEHSHCAMIQKKCRQATQCRFFIRRTRCGSKGLLVSSWSFPRRCVGSGMIVETEAFSRYRPSRAQYGGRRTARNEATYAEGGPAMSFRSRSITRAISSRPAITSRRADCGVDRWRE